jgi:CspA family cold shock protein
MQPRPAAAFHRFVAGIAWAKDFTASRFSFDGEIEMPSGKIKKVLPEKGFGFISGGSDDLFFHHSELRGVTIEELSEGQTVQYEIGQGKKGPCAVSVQLDK